MALHAVNSNVVQLINLGFVQLSDAQPCSVCSALVHYVGEYQPNGNWYCPACGHWIPFKSDEGAKIQVWQRAQKVTDADILFAGAN